MYDKSFSECQLDPIRLSEINENMIAEQERFPNLQQLASEFSTQESELFYEVVNSLFNVSKAR